MMHSHMVLEIPVVPGSEFDTLMSIALLKAAAHHMYAFSSPMKMRIFASAHKNTHICMYGKFIYFSSIWIYSSENSYRVPSYDFSLKKVNMIWLKNFFSTREFPALNALQNISH